MEIESRKVTIRSFKITKINIPEVSFKISCSKGTYIRSIANDFGKALNSGAHLSELCRTKIGEYDLQEATNIIELEEKINLL